MPAPFVLSSDLVSAYPAKSVDLANFINGYKLDTGPVQNAQTGTSYTFALSDTTKTVTANNAAASVYTVPPQSAVVWEDYTTLRLLNLGAGVVTLTAGAGVTINGTATVAQYSSATLVRTALNTWTVAGSGTAPGMVLITPTSVAGSGVTVSGGQVSFSASTSVSVNGCFSATYENYLVRVNITNSSTSGAFINARMRIGGADESGASYRTQRLYQLSTTVVGAQDPSANTVMSIGYMASTQPTSPSLDGRIFSPFSAARTTIISDGVYIGSDNSFVQNRMAAQLFNTTSYDSISFLAESGNMTGTLRIYGLRNS